MKIGFTQIILILVIAGIILLTIRGAPRRKAAQSGPKRTKTVRKTVDTEEEAAIKNARRKRFRWLGIAFVIIGLVALGSIIKIFTNIFTAVLSSGVVFSLIAIIVVLCGLVFLVFSIRR
ncbi:MAG: hypothetical protein FWH42_01810 [Dehalococcoidia bacterium]|nr:hypothetical protein [Dehalococcoidia bacterium]